MWEVSEDVQQPANAEEAITWFKNRLNQAITDLEKQFESYRVSEALMTIYRLYWDDFASWYLEAIKPGYQKPIDKITFEETRRFLEKLLQLLHPFMPFITEEIWHLIDKRTEGDSISTSNLPSPGKFHSEIITNFDQTKETVAAIRNIRKDKNIANKETIDLKIYPASDKSLIKNREILKKLGNVSSIEFVSEKINNAVSFRISADEFYVPIGGLVDNDEEQKKLAEELKYQKGFLASVEKKLSNEKFVNNAPEKVVAQERKKKSDAEEKIKMLEDRIRTMEE